MKKLSYFSSLVIARTEHTSKEVQKVFDYIDKIEYSVTKEEEKRKLK